MLETYGLSHLALKVKDLEKSIGFYKKLFGAKVMYQKENFVQFQTPNTRDIIVLEKNDDVIPVENIIHFGFRLVNPIKAEDLAEEVQQAGGTIKEKGEFVPGEPYVFAYDPDGYEVEIWFEKIPPDLGAFN